MRVVCPITKVNPGVVTAFAYTRHPIEFVDVSGSADSYWELLNELWTSGEGFAIVEQDIVVNSLTFEEFYNCPNGWCVAPYPYLNSQTYYGLGCASFRGSFTKLHPFVMDDVAKFCYPGHHEKHWCTLDAALQRTLGRLQLHPCRAHSPVGHLHTSPSHGCVPGYETSGAA